MQKDGSEPKCLHANRHNYWTLWIRDVAYTFRNVNKICALHDFEKIQEKEDKNELFHKYGRK